MDRDDEQAIILKHHVLQILAWLGANGLASNEIRMKVSETLNNLYKESGDRNERVVIAAIQTLATEHLDVENFSEEI